DDYWIVKIDSVGNIQWEKSLGGKYEDIAYSVQQTRDSGYVVAGWSNSYDGDVTGDHGTPRQGAPGDFWIVKLHEKVKSCYSDTINFDTVNVRDCKQYIYCFADNGGAPYLFSGVVFFGANANEFSLRSATFKELKPGNEEEVVLNFCPSAIGERTAIAGLIVSDTDTIFIPLYGTGVQPAGVAMQSPGSPLLSARNYPNPFSSITQLEYMVAEAGKVRVTVVDNVGEAVAEILDGWQAAGTHTIAFDAKHLPAGAYFVRYSCNGMVTTKPIMMLR
ncbi:MAG TPA: T9SS type A sorting domain-containing protein, partial [Candidatus Kapabacteria bacterium]|nr:T9SS type A sorting domain-containing protein [Candidatus Kapabacteria bacterium]